MPAPAMPPPDVVEPPSAARASGPTLLRVVAHALWIGPVVTTVLRAGLVLSVGAADHDLDALTSTLAVIGVVMVAGLPVSLGCSAAVGLTAGAAAQPLRRSPLGVQAAVGALSAVVVVGTALALLWRLDETGGVLAVLLVALACLCTGGLSVLLAGGVGRSRVPVSPEVRRAAPWVAPLGAVALTGALVGIGFGWFHLATHLSDDDATGYADPDLGVPLTPAPPMPQPVPEPPSIGLARTELEVLQQQAVDAGGADLPWQVPLAIAEAGCTTDAGTPGTALTLTGRFSTRDLATASDNVDFLLITQDNEKVAARIVDAWTDGHEERADVMKGEYWLVPAGTVTVREAHVGFDRGVGEVRVTSVCATG